MESIDERKRHYERARITCVSCGEVIFHGDKVEALAGITLCRRCAFGLNDDTNSDESYLESSPLVH